MKNNVILVLPYPVSANRYWQTRVLPAAPGRPAMASTYVSKEAKEYKAKVQAAALAAGLVEPIFGRVQIDVRLFPHRPLDWQTRQRKHGAAWSDTVQCLDLDNTTKVLLDALKGVVMDDDKWVRRIISERMEPDEHGARVVVRVLALEVEQQQLALEGCAV